MCSKACQDSNLFAETNGILIRCLDWFLRSKTHADSNFLGFRGHQRPFRGIWVGRGSKNVFHEFDCLTLGACKKILIGRCYPTCVFWGLLRPISIRRSKQHVHTIRRSVFRNENIHSWSFLRFGTPQRVDFEGVIYHHLAPPLNSQLTWLWAVLEKNLDVTRSNGWTFRCPPTRSISWKKIKVISLTVFENQTQFVNSRFRLV